MLVLNPSMGEAACALKHSLFYGLGYSLSIYWCSSKEWHEDLSVSHSAEQHTFTQPTEMHDDSEQVYIVHMKIMLLFFLKRGQYRQSTAASPTQIWDCLLKLIVRTADAVSLTV